MVLAREHNPRGRIMAEDTFDQGMNGWVQLIGSQYPIGVCMWDGSYAFGNSRGSLLLECGDGAADGTPNNWGTAYADKRLWRGSTSFMDVIEMEWVWYFGSQYDSKSPRAVIFGLDEASPTADPRNFFQIRWNNYDVGTFQRTGQYQMMKSDSTWVNVPAAVWQSGTLATGDNPNNTIGGSYATPQSGTAYAHGWNENKRDWHHLYARFDVKLGQYVGLKIDGDPFGCYTGNPADEAAFRAISPPHQTLPTFENGMNAVFAIANRSDSPKATHSWAGLGYFRAETVWTP